MKRTPPIWKCADLIYAKRNINPTKEGNVPLIGKRLAK